MPWASQISKTNWAWISSHQEQWVGIEHTQSADCLHCIPSLSSCTSGTSKQHVPRGMKDCTRDSTGSRSKCPWDPQWLMPEENKNKPKLMKHFYDPSWYIFKAWRFTSCHVSLFMKISISEYGRSVYDSSAVYCSSDCLNTQQFSSLNLKRAAIIQ